MKKLLLFLSLGFVQQMNAQLVVDTLAFQDFEVAPASPVWTFTGPVIYNSGFSIASAAPPNSPIGIGGSRAWETTVNSGGLILDFANVIVPAGYDSVRVRFNLAAMCLTAPSGGPDDLDYVLTAVSVDGGVTYYNRERIRGAIANNSFWPYSATGVGKVYYQPQTEVVFQPTVTGLQTTLGYSTVEIVFPGAVTQIAIRITGRSSSSTDTWLVDNLVMTGEYMCASSTSSISPVVCGSYTAPGGSVHTVSASFNDTISNVNGCDSIISINLTVNNPSTSSINPVVCGSYNSPAGNIYTSSGMYMDTIPNVTGCDSVITINLIVNNSSASSISPLVCDSYVSPSGNTYTSSGMYMDTIPNVMGCDSVITVNLTINVVDTSITLSGASLTANGNGLQYQWIDCGNGNAQIPGETAQTYMPTVNGNYAVIVTDGICTDTSSCHQVLSTGSNAISGTLAFTLLPTNTGDFVFELLENGSVDVKVYDALGQLVQNLTVVHGTRKTISFEFAGVYFVEVKTSAGKQNVKRVVVSK